MSIFKTELANRAFEELKKQADKSYEMMTCRIPSGMSPEEAFTVRSLLTVNRFKMLCDATKTAAEIEMEYHARLAVMSTLQSNLED